MMKPFLDHVAEHILDHYGTDLSRVAVVFPNKRASLFLNGYLVSRAGHPVWSPAYITISDLFRRHSTLSVADPIKLVCDLHRVFCQVTGSSETLDHFYGWGQLLLADFDDIDKNMAPADKVFANVRDLRELDHTDYLTDEQKAVISKFFSNFTDSHETELKERFLRLWSRMSEIYSAFNDHLFKQQLAYEGALYRQVATASDLSFSYDHYLFVGFNMLQQVEQRLFTMLKEQGKAHFYWDFDHYYMPARQGATVHNHEAGHYIALYQALFPNELDSASEHIYNQFSQPKQIAFISAATENIQARYISQWLTPQRVSAGRRTAIVLCNEALLPVTIHCLPETVDKVNITTGYPLSQSPVAAFVQQLLALQTTGYVPSRDQYRLHHVGTVLRHPFAAYVSPQALPLYRELCQSHIYYPDRRQLAVDEGTQLLFATPVNNNEQLLGWLCQLLQTIARQSSTDDPLLQESLFRTYELVNRLRTLTSSGDLAVDVVTLSRLLSQLVRQTAIPFHGEPAEGLQIMGVLETRNLDFDHVLLLSCNEGNVPRGVGDNSFIPYNIRRAYSLTTIDHKVSIYSYYFHRLLQRASDITIVYNNATSDGQTGEMSRFMLQLMVESPHHIIFNTLQAGQQLVPRRRPTIGKTPAVMERLMHCFAAEYHPDALTRPLLTPTAINRYLRCPLRFYYNYACKLPEPDNAADDDSIDNRIFGNIFHEASRLIYTRLARPGRQVQAMDIERLLHNRAEIERAADEAIRTELFHSKTMLPLGGLQIISREVIIHYLILLLRQDLLLTPFTIVGLERDVVRLARFRCGDTVLQTSIGGRIDRMDLVTDKDTHEECIRVIDYKTGATLPGTMPDVEAIFDPTNLSRHSDYYLQALLYACLVQQSMIYNPDHMAVSPALLFIQHSAANPVLQLGGSPISDVAQLNDHFARCLKDKIEEIFDPTLPFTPTDNDSRCRNCPYSQLCRTPANG